MRRLPLLAAATGGMLAMAASVTAVPRPRTVECRITFDDGLRTADGVAPTVEQGVQLAQGRTGRAVRLVHGSRLAYPTAGHYDPKRGTVDLWVCPSWNARDTKGDRTFWAVGDDPGKENRVGLGFFGSGTSGIAYFCNNGGVDGVIVPVDWKAGEWHRVTACWDERLGQRALALDGVLVGTVGYTRPMPSQQKEFYVGCMAPTAPNGGLGLEMDGLVDEVHMTGAIGLPEFARTAAARQRYRPALERLQRDVALERVAAQKREVGFADVRGLATPLSYRVPVQAAHHPDFVWVQPDMAVTLGAEADSLTLGFAVGDPPKLPDMWKVTRRLRKGYQPIVESRWQSGAVRLVQTAFAYLPADERVATGTETQYAVVRLAVTNTGKAPARVPLHVLVGRNAGSQLACYAPYTTPASRWENGPRDAVWDGGTSTLSTGPNVLLTCRCSGHATAAFHRDAERVVDGAPRRLTDCLTFDLDLQPGETRTVDIVAPGTSRLYPTAEAARMHQVDVDRALRTAAQRWERELAPAMKLATPEKRIDEVFKAVTLSCLQMLVQPPNERWQVPIQTALGGTWSWEFAHMAAPLASIGYGPALLPAFRYYTLRQNGVGPASAGAGPTGDVKSTKGSYTGTVMFWMNETGSVLWAMAAYYEYTRGDAWLLANRPSILAAWDWIQGERAHTRVTGADGKRVPQWGLLPAGVPDDTGGKVYHLTLTDNFTWFGMDRMARAFRLANLPEAERLTAEAAEYRRCILDAVERERRVDPETGLPFIPNTVGGKPGDRYWMANGPVQLFDTGLLAPADPYFPAMVEYTKRKYGILMGMAEHCEGGMEWYPNQTERAFYKCYLARGEPEKALLVLYCNLTYGMANDTYQTCERFHADDPNFSPLQPNASGNGRNIDMLRRMLVDEQDAESGTLWLLRGCPRRWFAPGKSVSAQNVPTIFGTMSVRARAAGGTVTVDVDAPDRQVPEEVRVVVRHPGGKAPRRATADGRPAHLEGETVVLVRPTGRVRVVCSY